jgi:hypothetical protein
VFGYVFDSAGSVRPLRGILGSATVGPPVALDYAVREVLTLDARHAIASSESSPELLSLDLGTTPPSIAAITGAPSNPSLAAASARGAAAAFYRAAEQRVWITTGLPLQPKTSQAIDLSLAGPVARMAIRDDGQALVYAVKEGDGETLYGWSAVSGKSQFLAPAASVGAVVITDKNAIIVADRGANEIFAVWDTGASPIRQFLAGEKDGISNPVGLAVAGNRIHVANSGASTVVTLDFMGRPVQSHACVCEISGLAVLRDSVFRLTGKSDGAIFLFDTSSTGDRIVFVPKPEVAQ